VSRNEYPHLRGVKTSKILNRLRAAPARQRALWLGFLSVASALLSWYLPPPDYLFVSHTPLPPAFWFGLVLCAGVALWSSRSPLVLSAVLLATFVAWVAAVETTLRLQDSIEQQVVSLNPPATSLPALSSPVINYVWGLCGMVGGMIGSAIVVFAIAAATRNLRTSNRWASVILFGTIAGFFLEFAEIRSATGLFVHISSLLPLFLVWQVGVAALIAYNLAPAAIEAHGAPVVTAT
jgi:hypothetical protein